MSSISLRQPKAFYLIFMLELWERFGFYTMQGILVLYFVRKMGLSETMAYHTFGAFSALVYALVALGGYLGDVWLGTKRSIVLGLLVLALGYGSLALVDQSSVFWALGLICVGNGIFKANPAHLLSQFYEQNDARLDGAFTLYYMAVNIGAVFALFLGPILATRYGYAYAYFASCLGLVIGLINYTLHSSSLRAVYSLADKRAFAFWQWSLLILMLLLLTSLCAYLLQHLTLARSLTGLVFCAVTAIYLSLMRQQDSLSKRKMLLALILMLEAILFFTLYQQMPTSINLFAVHHVRPFLFGLPIEPQSFQVLNSIWIMILSPILAYFYLGLNARGISIAMPYKFALGMGSSGLGFFILYLARYAHDKAYMIAGEWLLLSYFFQSLGELLISALGVAMVAELVPAKWRGFIMGMWFLTSSIAGFIGAYVASLTASHQHATAPHASLLTYTHTFALIGLVAIALSIVMAWTAPMLGRFLNPT